MKTKIKTYRNEVKTNFQGKKYQKKKLFINVCLDSVVKVNKKYYPQTLLDECKYEMKKTKMENLTDDDLNPSSSDESDNETDSESDNETDMNLTMILIMNLIINLLINLGTKTVF